MNPRQLYKYLMRGIKRLPNHSQSYYKNLVKGQFNSYSDETDPERVQQLVEKGIKDSEWLFYTKYGLKKPNN